MYYVERRRRHAIDYVHQMFNHEFTTDDEYGKACTRQALFCINLLSSKLGDNKYFYGDR
jgi:hypothetical protein